MYKAFKTEFTIPKSKDSHYYDKGSYVYKGIKKKIDNHLQFYRNSDGSLQGSKLSANWFPQLEADVFISHSHKDVDTALIFAGWLSEKQGIVSFIDSCVWGYANDLLKAIDDEYCYQPEKGTYDYQKRNFSTSHVHMMLSIALTRMMYNTECLFFLNTPNSIIPKNVIKGSSTAETISPWIFAEIEMSKLVKKRDIEEHRNAIFEKSASFGALTINHEVDLSHLVEITHGDLKLWGERNYINKFEALDALYKKDLTKGVIHG
ncbi:MAG: hypothetical protein HGB15_07660 [Chlorobaculum sp.]|nr:hypothetical protein [Chlorobaculum sp.]